MEEKRANPPFQSLAFTLVEAVRGRSVIRMSRRDDGTYRLHVEQGSGGNPRVDFTREVPQETAQRLKDALQDAGVFAWEESYGDIPGLPTMKWTFNVVFKTDVFSVASRGGSDVPAGFDAMMEQFYRLDLPRPEEDSAPVASPATMPFGGMDFSKLADMMHEGGLPDFARGEMADMLSEAASNPAAFQQRMQSEFRAMPHDQREQLLDTLASLGMASRAWWENFFNGGAL